MDTRQSLFQHATIPPLAGMCAASPLDYTGPIVTPTAVYRQALADTPLAAQLAALPMAAALAAPLIDNSPFDLSDFDPDDLANEAGRVARLAGGGAAAGTPLPVMASLDAAATKAKLATPGTSAMMDMQVGACYH